MQRSQDAENDRQKRFFERDPARVSTVLYGNPRFPRNMKKKVGFVAERFQGCGRLLEIGVGRGLQVAYLRERLGTASSYVGLDIALSPLTQARHRIAAADGRGAVLANGLAEELPFADESFDAAFCLDVLHHARSQVAMLSEIGRVLRPGGRVLCLEPNPRHPANLIYRRNPIEQRLFDLEPDNARSWAEVAGLVETGLAPFPVFFPSFPAFLDRAYDWAEGWLARVPGLRSVSTTLVLSARRPPLP